jgi:hypothetical protein
MLTPHNLLAVRSLASADAHRTVQESMQHGVTNEAQPSAAPAADGGNADVARDAPTVQLPSSVVTHITVPAPGALAVAGPSVVAGPPGVPEIVPAPEVVAPVAPSYVPGMHAAQPYAAQAYGPYAASSFITLSTTRSRHLHFILLVQLVRFQ